MNRNQTSPIQTDLKHALRRSSSPMHVMHIIKHCGWANGSVHMAIDLACVQAQCGHQVSFVSAGGTFKPLLERYGVDHIHLPHDQNSPIGLLWSTGKLVQLVRKTQPNVLHAHMMSSALIGYVASKLSGAPLVTTVHNSFDRHSVLMRLGHKVVAVSEAERKQLLERGYSSDQLKTVMNAPSNSPREGFIPDDRELSIESPCITAVNGLHRRKGVFDLIAACTEVFREFPEWKLYIAGEGPDRAELENQAKLAGMSERIIFLGLLPSPRILLERSDIFVLASYADPCSLAIGEARAAGCAIVATAVGGTPEMLEFGRAGRLVAPGNPSQLAAELRTLMADEGARNQLRAAALNGAEIFDVYRLIDDYDQVYREAYLSSPSSTKITVGVDSPAA